MTVVIGIKHDGMVTMCADSCSSSRDYIESLQANENGKIGLSPNGVLFGISGDSRIKSFIMTNSDIFDFADKSFTRANIAKEFVPRLMDIQKNNGLLENNGDSSATILLAKDDKLYLMTDEWNVYSVNHYEAIGFGGYIACSSLIKQEGDPEKMAISACKFASKNCYGVAGPYVVINTKDKVFKEAR